MAKTTTTMTMAMGLALATALGGVGCMTEGDEGDELLAEDEQAFSSLGTYSWGDTTYSKADIGTGTGRACFLSGLAGNVTTWTFPAGTSQGGAGVQLNTATNRWEIYVDPATTGSTLQAWARCVPSTTLTASVTWRTGDPKRVLGAVTANRRCFLTSITTGRDNQFAHGGFQSPLDNVFINNDGVNWYLSGSVEGLVWAKARCTDVTQDLGQFFNWAGTGTTQVVPLVSAANGSACMLTQISGQIDNSSDWNAGPVVSYNAGYNFYDYTAKDGNGGRARCVR